MTTLREAYKKHKQDKSAAVQEAAVRWVMENVVLLDENFNRESLQRLQSSIAKFDAMFAPYGAKVPEVKRSLDDAVELLNRITMGEKVVRKDGRLRLTQEEQDSLQDPATYMVKYMSMLYNNLSRFFNKDMRILLELPLFELARKNQQVPLKDLAEAPRMRKAILHALAPNAETNAILRRMYRSMELPSLEYEIIADQLLNLTAADFMALTNVDRVPLVATAPPEATAPAPAMEAATSTNPKVQNGDEVLTEDEEALLKEIGEVNPAQIQQVVSGIQKIQTVIRAFPELQQTNQALEQLRSQALAAVAGGFRNPSSKTVAATANVVYNYFDKLGDLGQRIDVLIPADRPMTEGELQNLQTLLTKAEGGIMQKMGNFFKTRINPQLSPSNLNSQIMQVIQAGQAQGNVAAGESIKNFFKRIQALKLPPAMTPQGQPVAPGGGGQAAPTQGAAGPQPTAPVGTGAAPAPAGQTAQTGATAPQAAPGAAPQSNAMNPVEVPEIINAAAKTMGVSADSPMFQQQMNKLVQAGWKLIPPGR